MDVNSEFGKSRNKIHSEQQQKSDVLSSSTIDNTKSAHPYSYDEKSIQTICDILLCIIGLSFM